MVVVGAVEVFVVNESVIEVGTVRTFVDCTVGNGDGVVGGATRCGDSGGCEESSSIDETLP